MAQDQRPSFFSSVMSGISGAVKGALSGGIVGTLAGGIIGAVVALISPDTIAAALPEITVTAGNAVLTGALGFAGIGAYALGVLGASAGTITGVLKSREANTVPTDVVIEATKMAMVQGMAIEHQRAAVEQESTKWRDRIGKEQQAAQLPPKNPTMH